MPFCCVGCALGRRGAGQSFELLEGFFARLLAACSHGGVEPVFVLIGNKCDLDRAVSKQHVKKWCAAKRRMGFEVRSHREQRRESIAVG